MILNLVSDFSYLILALRKLFFCESSDALRQRDGCHSNKKPSQKIIKIRLERWGFWQLCTTFNFCKKTIFDCATNMLFLAKLRSKTAKTPFWQGATVTRNYLNFGKMPNLIVNADFREDSKSGLRSKIEPIKHKIENMPFFVVYHRSSCTSI